MSTGVISSVVRCSGQRAGGAFCARDKCSQLVSRTLAWIGDLETESRCSRAGHSGGTGFLDGRLL